MPGFTTLFSCDISTGRAGGLASSTSPFCDDSSLGTYIGLYSGSGDVAAGAYGPRIAFVLLVLFLTQNHHPRKADINATSTTGTAIATARVFVLLVLLLEEEDEEEVVFDEPAVAVADPAFRTEVVFGRSVAW